MDTYGFLFSEEVGRRIFFHFSNFNRATNPQAEEKVEFQLAPAKNPANPDAAVNVTPVVTL
jgi:cold shock CspA family protein